GLTAPPLTRAEARQVEGGTEFERLGALCAGYRDGPRKAGFDLSGRCTLRLHKLPLDAFDLTFPHEFIIGRDEGLCLGDDAQPRFGLPSSRIGRSEHAEISGLIPTDAECCAISRILAHDLDACLYRTLLNHRPATKKQSIYAPVAQIVAIGQLNDGFGMSWNRRNIAEQFTQAGASEVVDVRCEVRLIQLDGAAERFVTRTTRLFGKTEDPEHQRKIGEGRDLRVMNIVHRLRSMLTPVVHL